MALRAIKVSMSGESETNFTKFISGRLDGIISSLTDFHTNKLPGYRKLYEAKPDQEVRTFPFKNASNLVVPIVAIHVDTLLARIMSAILKMRPIWPVKLMGSFGGSKDEMRTALEDYLTEQAIEPDGLNLYDVYKPWFKDAINIGLGIVKIPWETKIETEVSLDSTGKISYFDETKYEGPRPQRLLLEDFFINASDVSVGDSWFKAHRRRLTRSELEWRAARGLYDQSAVSLILSSPDRSGAEEQQVERESDIGVNSGATDDYNAEWDIYECHIKYMIDNHLVRLIVSYHKGSQMILRSIYNPFKDDCFEAACLFPRDGLVIGYGFAERLSSIAEELSQCHNQRRDAQTVANAKVWRISPNSQLNAGFDIYPGARLPGEDGEVEPMSHGEPSPFQIDEERVLLDLAERLTGVTPPMQGYGSGQSGKRGVYSAVATLSLLQEGNTRGDMNISDLRAAHMKLGRKVTRQIAEFGLSKKRFKAYGEMSDLLYQAFEAVKDGSVSMPILAATAALNNEVEKQSDMILVNVLRQHYMVTSQMLGQVQSQMVPKEVRDYVMKTITAADALMKMIVRHFGYDDIDKLVPKALPQGQQGAQDGRALQTRTRDAQLAGPTGGSEVPGFLDGGVGSGTGGPGQVQ